MTSTEIHALSRLIDRMDYYRLLRVTPGAPSPEIRLAYHRARREFHPDAFLRSEPELRQSVEIVARRVNEAYLTLRDPQRRARYDADLERGQLREKPRSRMEIDAASQGRTPNGRRFYAQALAEERAGRLDEAISQLRMALTFEREHEGFQAKLREIRSRRQAGGL